MTELRNGYDDDDLKTIVEEVEAEEAHEAEQAEGEQVLDELTEGTVLDGEAVH